MSGYSRGVPAMGDVLRSVLVLGAIVVGLFMFGKIFTVTPENPTSEVDWRTAASSVESRAGFVPLVPSDVPADWRATRAELIDTRWQLGFVTGGDDYIGMSQVPGTAKGLDDLVADRAPEGKPVGEEQIDGRAWRVLVDPDDTTTFAAQVGGEAVVVTGTAKRSVLRDYVASLEPFSD